MIAASDLDHMQDAALLQLPGGRAVSVRVPFDQVLEWFLEAATAPPSRMTREVTQAALSVANLRLIASRLLRLLLDEGVVSRSEVAAMRNDCLEVAQGFAAAAEPVRQAYGVAAAQDVKNLFNAARPDLADQE